MTRLEARVGIDFVKLHKNFRNRNKYVALDGNYEVIARGKDRLEVENKAEKMGYKDVLVTYIPRFWSSRIFSAA